MRNALMRHSGGFVAAAVDSFTFRRRTLPALLLAASGVGPLRAAAASGIVVFGDSQAEGLAAALQRASRRLPGLKIENHTRPGSSISQSAAYDWPAAIAGFVPGENDAVAVLMFGGNDRLPMRLASGASLPFRAEAWRQEYRARVAAMLHSLLAAKLRVVWVGDPICRDPHYSQDMAYLNTIYQDVLAGSGAVYVDIWTVVADAAGQYAAYGRAPDGGTARLRLDDGIHFTPAGYDLLAARVLAVIQATPPEVKEAPK